MPHGCPEGILLLRGAKGRIVPWTATIVFPYGPCEEINGPIYRTKFFCLAAEADCHEGLVQWRARTRARYTYRLCHPILNDGV